MEGYGPSSYGDGFADVYDDWYSDITDVDATVDRLVALVDAAGGGPVLELGVGSGRLAIPLAARGVEVHGVDASAAMLDRLRAKPGGGAVHAVHADMAEPEAGDRRFAVVYVAFNTFFNLVSEDDQRRCLHAVARALRPDGRFVLEAFVPGAPGSASTVEVRHLAVDEVVLSASRTDAVRQVVEGQHVHITEAGIRLRPWAIHYLTPAQLDDLAADAGLELVDRHGGWRGEPFESGAEVHVSTFRCVHDPIGSAQ